MNVATLISDFSHLPLLCMLNVTSCLHRLEGQFHRTSVLALRIFSLEILIRERERVNLVVTTGTI